jgi:cobalt-precorrin 5A hydrolase / cobalt-factor III methyltransferase / precorrin-3B C17-methyltransferase
MIGLVWATRSGASLAAHLERAWPDARSYPGRPEPALRAAWAECDGVVAFMAAGITVRLVAPLLDGKDRDPGLVCVDDAGRFAVALAGGHEGGGNRLAARVADALGAAPVVTTASEALGLPVLGELGADLGFSVEPGSDLAAVAGAMIAGDEVTLVSDQRWPLPPLPGAVVRARHPRPPCLLVTDRLLDPTRPAVVYRPPSLVVGVGCSRDAPAAEIGELIDLALAEAGLAGASVTGVASVDAKRNESGLLRAAGERGWPLRFHTSQTLARVDVPNPSAAVARAVGTPSVAEAAALAGGPATLVVAKRKSERATVAVARLRPRGRLYVVGSGPGDPGLLPPLAREALGRCELVVGLERYVDRVRGLLRPGTRVATSAIGGELERARLAVAEAAAGAAVALVSGGDAGVYGMASPALEAAPAEVDVIGVPGITAALAAAALLGAPLGHDHCAISLSDLLTPWPEIRRRLEAGSSGDFVISLYNPRSAGRSWQLEAARRLLLEHRKPATPVGLVTDAYRPGQRVDLTTLEDLDPSRVGMTTIVVIGSSQTRTVAGRMVTPRGYRAGEAAIDPEVLSGQGLVARARRQPEIPSDPHPDPDHREADPDHREAGPDGPERRPTHLPARPAAALPHQRAAHPIEVESYRILRSLIDLRGLGPLSRAVAERVVHASGDPDYATDLVLDEAALEAGLAALRGGAPIVVDARMVAAAITTRASVCALDLADAPTHATPATPGAPTVAGTSVAGTSVAGALPVPAWAPTASATTAAPEPPTAQGTRAAAGVRMAARAVGSGAVWVVGCAPTALEALLAVDVRPALVIGLPVGFVGAVEAKWALAGSGLPAVTNRGVKGGSAVAAAALNALLYLEGPP